MQPVENNSEQRVMITMTYSDYLRLIKIIEAAEANNINSKFKYLAKTVYPTVPLTRLPAENIAYLQQLLLFKLDKNWSLLDWTRTQVTCVSADFPTAPPLPGQPVNGLVNGVVKPLPLPNHVTTS